MMWPEFTADNLHWYWLSAGILLIALEAVIPGAVLLWFGVSALFIGGLTLVVDLSLNAQLMLFGVLSVSCIALFRYWRSRQPIDEDDAARDLNHPGQNLLGRQLTLVTAIENGVGRVAVADSSWRCLGPDLPAGSRVRVIGMDGSSLRVEAADQGAVDEGESEGP